MDGTAGGTERAVPAAWFERLQTRHVALAAAILLTGWFLVFPADASVVSDDGAYALAVRALDDGSWSVPYVLAEVDPDGIAYPFRNAERGENGYFPYVRRPAWVFVLRGGDLLGGALGMRLVVIAAAVGSIIATGALARVVGRGQHAGLAALLVALSPLLFQSLQLWGHAAAVAGVAVAMLGAVRAIEGRSVGWSAALASSGSLLAALVRSDGVVFAVAVGVITAGVGVRRRTPGAVITGLAVSGAASVGHLASGAAADSITGNPAGSQASALPASGTPAGELLTASVDTFVSSPGRSTFAFVLLLAAAVLALRAALCLRSGSFRDAVISLWLATALWVVRIVVARDDLVPGLVGAWPVVLLVFAVPLSRRTRQERWLLAMVALGALAVGATQYGSGGGANWGGRYLTPALPAFAVLVAGSLVRRREESRSPVLVSAAVVLSSVTLVASLVGDVVYRVADDRMVKRIEEVTADVPVVTSAIARPRLAWRTYPETSWLLVPSSEEGGAERLRSLLLEAGIDEVVGFQLTAAHLAALSGEDASDRAHRVPYRFEVGGP